MKTSLAHLVCLLWVLPMYAGQPNIILILADDLGYSDLGCYGGEIHTPNLDSLAANGLRMTQLYNTARCCSTRASLLTGLYPHQAGVGWMTADNGMPGYRGFLADRSVTIAQLLKNVGYSTYLSGKWHLKGKANPECTPINRGFDKFYGHFKAYASFWREDLYVHMPEPRCPTDFAKPFYATDALTTQALRFLSETREKDKPYFLYLSYNAPHFPLHAPKALIEKYVKIYDKGWGQIRESRFQNMNQSGIIPKEWGLSPRGHVTKVPERNRNSPYYDKAIPPWNSLERSRQKDLARRMATYAAMVEILDKNVGRVVQDLRDNNDIRNTLVLFLSDNGACAEWDPFGFDDNPYPKNRLYQGGGLQQMGQLGTFHSYGTGWANACNTPFSLYKHYTHEGGISSPFILHWPEGTCRKGEIDRQPAHLVDLAATLLDVGEAQYPGTWKGHKLSPLAGISLLPILRNQTLPQRPLYFEHEGNRAIRLGDWKCLWTNFDKKWELYNVSQDRTETRDLAREYPGKVKALSKKWSEWAQANFVHPEKVIQPAKGMPKIYYSPVHP